MRQVHHDDVDRLAGLVGGQLVGEAVLILHIHVDVRDHAHHRHAAELLEGPKTRTKEIEISPKLVDQKPLQPLLLLGAKECCGAVELGKDPASVDVANEQHWCVYQLSQPHIDDVPAVEIELHRAAGTLDHHNIRFCGKAVVRSEYLGDELGALFHILTGGKHCDLTAIDDNLTAVVGIGLQQDRVHPRIGSDAARLRLNHLRPAHLSAVAGDAGVERHILALEGGDPVAVLVENTTDTGSHEALPGIGHSPLDHKVLSHGTSV